MPAYPTLKIRETDETEVKVDPAFCFEQAAKCLQGHFYGGGNGPGTVEAAREWRELGIALRDTPDLY